MNSILDKMMAGLPSDTPGQGREADAPGVCPEHKEEKVRHLKFTTSAGKEYWTPWRCPTCAVEAETAAANARLDEARRAESEYRMSLSGLRGRFLDCTFENYRATSIEQRRVLEAVQKYFATPDGPLWLVGPVGTGKTHLAAAGVRHCNTVIGAQAVMLSTRQLIRDLRSTWEKGAEHTEQQRIEWFGELPVLVLDEVGVGFGSDAELTQLFDVLDLRYQMGRATVLLSNLAPSGIKEALGERLYDRMREGAQLLTCDWKSYRAAKGNA